MFSPEDPRVEQSRRSVIDATKHLMCREGLANITIESIAKQSGVAKTTIYRHWDSLDDILVSVIDDMMGHRPDKDTGSLEKDIIFNLDYLLNCFSRESWARCMPDIIERARLDKGFRQKKNQLMMSHHRPLYSAIERGIERGDLPKDTDVPLLVNQLLGPLFMSHFVHGKKSTKADISILVRRTLAGYQQ